MRCILCGEEKHVCIHEGTRDIPQIKVMKCESCGLVQLDEIKNNTTEKYSEGGMLYNTYSATNDIVCDMKWDTWVKETEWDDVRRYEALKDICRNKNVLEFGCGNGGFLRRIKDVAQDVSGIEMMDEARERLSFEGISTYKELTETDRKYDVVCMFNVIEHLNEPDEILQLVSNHLEVGGVFICETCNVDCALSTLYECRAYNDFTFWSQHVILFNSNTLEKLIKRNGFETQLNTQIERYSLANHLYWLSQGKPGGHKKWVEFNDTKLNNYYADKLIKMGVADTLWYCGIKRGMVMNKK